MNKENIAATPTFTRKRAKSFSTPPTAKLPAKSARGILKGNNGDDAHTIAFIPIHSPSKKRTESAEKRRKSLNRRVSFASHASVRLFEKPGESPPQTTPRRSTRLSPAKSPIRDQQPDSPLDNDDSNDEITMDLTNIIPRMAPMGRQTNPLSNPLADEDEDESDDSDDYEDAQDNEDDTAAMDLTDILPAPSNQAKMSPFSRIPRRSLSPVKRSGIATVEDGDTMDMTATIGKVLPLADVNSPFIESSQENDHNMDMTRLVGGILHAAQSAPNSPVRGGPLYPNLSLLNQKQPIEEDNDETMNMDETRIFSNEDRRSTLASDEPTSHTSYTVATEEDDTQRLCEGSVTQADGFTQNTEITRALPNQIQAQKIPSPVRSAGVGFSWGAAPIPAEQSLMDVSMADVSMADISMADATQNDETMNMDITQAIGRNILSQATQSFEVYNEEQTVNMEMTRVLSPTRVADQSVDMDVTRVLPSVMPHDVSEEADMSFTKVISNPASRTPTGRDLRGSHGASISLPHSASPTKSSLLKRRLSSGAVRTPRASPSPAVVQAPQVSTPVRSALPNPRRASIPRRKSLLETEIPQFGSPDAKILLEPGSAQKPEFGSDLVHGTDLRMSILKDKIQSLTPKKEPGSSRNTPVRQAIASTLKFPARMAKLATPQKTPQRSLLVPSTSVSRSSSMTPAKSTTETPLSPIALNEFLNMTGVSFLTGLSTSRRRETFVMPSKVEEVPNEDKEAAKMFANAYTVPMLEMYQHSCRELTRYITEGRTMCDEIEADINEQNPEIFDQYRRANAAGRREMEAKFKALKTRARLSAKGVWYVWRENLLSGVLVPLRKNLADLEQESARLKEYEIAATPFFEKVRQEYDQLKTTVDELLEEEDRYEAYDHEAAARLVKENAESEAKLEHDRIALAALQEQEKTLAEELASLKQQFETKSAEVESLEKEAELARGYSDEELAALRKENDVLVAKTGFQIQRVDGEQITLLFKESLIISMRTNGSNITLSLPAIEEGSAESVIKQYYLAQITQSLSDLSSTSISYKDILKNIKDQWSAVLALTAEFDILESSHPTSIQVNSDDNLAITTSILLTASRTKFLVHFVPAPVLAIDDLSIEVDVNVRYGGLDAAKVRDHVQSRLLSQNGQKKGRGWLLDSLKMPDGL